MRKTETARDRHGELLMKRHQGFWTLLALALFVAADWPGWRGPARDGHAPGVQLPEKWSPDSLRVVWRVPVGSGYSSPVIAGGKLYLHAREADQEVVLCLDAATGNEIWRAPYPAPYEMHPAARGHGLGPKATATVTDGKVFAFGISSILTCLEARDGKILWQRDLKEDFDAEPAEYGTAGSPLVDAGRVVVPVGGKRGGAVMAFRTDTGEMIWKAVPGEMPAMSSPLTATLVGVPQVITFTEKHFVGLDPQTGRVLWKHPFTTPYRQNIVTPVVVDNLVIASGTGQPGFALRVDKNGESLGATEVWTNPRFQLYTSSPIAVGHYVYGLNWRGELVSVNARDGKTAWTKAGFGKYATIVVAGDQLLVLASGGELTVVAADPKAFRELARFKLTEAETWSHLAVVENRLYIRDLQEVTCFELSK